MLAAARGSCPPNGNSELAAASDWADYDVKLARFDAGLGPEPAGPEGFDPPGWLEEIDRREAERDAQRKSELRRRGRVPIR